MDNNTNARRFRRQTSNSNIGRDNGNRANEFDTNHLLNRSEGATSAPSGDFSSIMVDQGNSDNSAWSNFPTNTEAQQQQEWPEEFEYRLSTLPGQPDGAPLSPGTNEADTEPLVRTSSREDAANLAIAFGHVTDTNTNTNTATSWATRPSARRATYEDATDSTEDETTDRSDIESPRPTREHSVHAVVSTSLRNKRVASTAVGATLLGTFLGLSLIDEDDVVAAAVLAKTATAGGGGTAAVGTSAQVACCQQMAIVAAQGAANSVATGTAAASSAAAAGGSGALLSAAGNAASNAGPSTTAATAVAGIVVSAMLLSGGEVTMLCPNVPEPDIMPGRMTLDFFGADLLSVDEAQNLAQNFADTYNGIMGCESEYSRIILNCTVPCSQDAENSTTCCENYEDGIFGELLRCSFDCFVHCDGCLPNEPLFLTELLDTTTPAPSAGPLPSIDSSVSRLQENYDDGHRLLFENTTMCSPQCQVSKAMETEVCGKLSDAGDSCFAVRSLTYDLLEMNSQKETVTLVPLPTTMPSPAPSTAPSFVPSAVPSVVPSTAPTALIFEDLILFNDSMILLGPLANATVFVAAVGSALTVEARVSRPVESVEFYLDGELVRIEKTIPYFINADDNGIAFPFAPLAVAGDHNVTAIARSDMRQQLGYITALFTVV